ncbi:MAG: hypothetical protein HOE11_02805 [Candidatus Diapherotrites archaeon]|jgi:hypothetical protein|nr:hypothetical protein [Candidatus Diapherotrites archaeon]MBT4596761.1 hypothetical protein [Candidatus Diapherotrites archaeon]
MEKPKSRPYIREFEEPTRKLLARNFKTVEEKQQVARQFNAKFSQAIHREFPEWSIIRVHAEAEKAMREILKRIKRHKQIKKTQYMKRKTKVNNPSKRRTRR